jgi:glycosyltransferase involved in cell wall biosynthesis
VLVDPLDVAALADTLQALLADSARRAQLRELGLRRAAQFTWERTALQTWDFYQRVAAREL